MPYCPKCDMEFVDGITVCTDCGGPLVESKEAAEAMKAAEALKKAEALRAAGELRAAELLEDAEEIKGEELTPEETRAILGTRVPPGREQNSVYVDKSQKYSDLKSSASAFLIAGCCLAVISVLLWTDVIRLPMAPASIMILRIALTAMAVFSLGVFAGTSRSAKKLAPQIEQEKRRTRELIQWFTDRYSAEDIDREIAGKDELTEEELSLKRFRIIQDFLITGQDLPDPAYVDALCEELYGKLFEPAP